MYPILSLPLYSSLHVYINELKHTDYKCTTQYSVMQMNVLKTTEYPRHYALSLSPPSVCVCVCVCVRACACKREYVCIHMCSQCMQIQIHYQDCEETQCRFRSQEWDLREGSCGHKIANSIP
jgi:hypothetical protein